jgi:hypothetical protein
VNKNKLLPFLILFIFNTNSTMDRNLKMVVYCFSDTLHGLNGPHGIVVFLDGMKFVSQQLKDPLYLVQPGLSHICQYCPAWVACDDSDSEIPHQPSLAALTRSTQSCIFCFMLVGSMQKTLGYLTDQSEDILSNPFGQATPGADLSGKELAIIQASEKVTIQRLPNSKNGDIRRLWVHWSGYGFEIRGELFAFAANFNSRGATRPLEGMFLRRKRGAALLNSIRLSLQTNLEFYRS